MSSPRPFTPPSTTRTPARRTRIGGGGEKRAQFLILFYILSFSPCLFCSGEGWKKGDGFEVPEPDLFGEDSPSTSNHLQNSSPAQPSRAPVMNAIPCAIRFNPSELLMFLFNLLACLQHDQIQCCLHHNMGSRAIIKIGSLIPYPTAFPYGNGMVLHFCQQQESSTTTTVHKVINKGLKT